MTIITVEGSPPPGSIRCAPPHSGCGNHCCNPGSRCISGICCPIGSTLVGEKCCPKGHNIIGSICCAPSDSCGKVCCGGDPSAPGLLHFDFICANPKLGLCCSPGQVDKNGICCTSRGINCNGTCCGGSCVSGECIETLAECKVRGSDSSCSRQKPCPIGYGCIQGCCIQGPK